MSVGSAGFLAGDSGSHSMSAGTFMSQISYANAPAGDVLVSTLPKGLPQIGKKKGSRPGTQEDQEAHQVSKEKRRASSEGRPGSKEATGSKTKPAPGAVNRNQLTAKEREQRAKELAALKDPFEDWRKNEIGARYLNFFQQQLRSNEGLSTLQHTLKGESHRFKNFQLKEMDDDTLFDVRLKFGPAGMKVVQNAKKKEDAYKKENWAPTEEGVMRNSTNNKLFNYFGTHCSGEQPRMADLSKLLKKSHTHGANLTKLAKEEEARQLAERRRLRAEKMKKMDELAKLCQKPMKKPSPKAGHTVVPET